MQIIVLCISLIFLAATGCSSSSKKEAVNKAEATMEKVEQKADAAKKDVKAKMTDSMASATCSLKSDKRTIETKDSGSGCEVMYTKFGESTSVASGSKSHCESVVEKMKANLSAAGFSCE